MPQKTNHSGFAAVEAILIGVILVILGGTGYYVWHAKQNADNALSNANSASASTKTATPTTKNKKTVPTTPSTVLSSYDPVVTPDILPKLNADMKTQKLVYNYMIIGEWGVKASTIDTTNVQLPYYLNYREDITDNNNALVSVVMFSGADDSGNDKTCSDGAVGPVVYMMRDSTADSLGYTDFQPISDLNVAGHVFHVYEEHCKSDTNKAAASAIERQLETLTIGTK